MTACGRVLGGVCLGIVLLMTTWFSAAAISPSLMVECGEIGIARPFVNEAFRNFRGGEGENAPEDTVDAALAEWTDSEYRRLALGRLMSRALSAG